MSITIKGQDKVLKKLNKLADPEKTFDKQFKRAAAIGFKQAREATQTKQPASKSFTYQGMQITAKNLNTGLTANAWQVRKIGKSSYQLINERKSEDGKHSIANLLDKGHGEIRPRKRKMLFMPLSRAGQAKPPGQKGTGLKYGQDYIFLQRVKPRKGLGYIKELTTKGSRQLTREIIAAIRRLKI